MPPRTLLPLLTHCHPCHLHCTQRPAGTSPEASDVGEGDEEGEESDGDAAANAGSGSEGSDAEAAAAACVAPDVPQLPEQCWMLILQQLSVRDVCMAGRTNR